METRGLDSDRRIPSMSYKSVIVPAVICAPRSEWMTSWCRSTCSRLAVTVISRSAISAVSTNKELNQKTLAKEKLTNEESEHKDDAAKRRDGLKKRLQRFITRIPAFMYLTDDREKTIKDIITQIEPELFEKVTGLTLLDFRQLVDAGMFNDAQLRGCPDRCP